MWTEKAASRGVLIIKGTGRLTQLAQTLGSGQEQPAFLGNDDSVTL
jgi:hypothetical protein